MPFWVYRAMNALALLLLLFLHFAFDLLAFVCWFHKPLFLSFKTFILIGLLGRLLIGLPCRLLIGLFFILWWFFHGVVAGLESCSVTTQFWATQFCEVGADVDYVATFYGWHIVSGTYLVDRLCTRL